MEDNRDAHGFLRACYLNDKLPVTVRIRAADIAIGYERPKLAATAILTNGSLGAQLERASKRVELIGKAQAEGNPNGWMEPFREFCRRQKARLIEAQPIEIEAKAIENGAIADPVEEKPMRRL